MQPQQPPIPSQPMSVPPAPAPTPGPQGYPGGPAPTPNPLGPGYDFILNPAKPPRKHPLSGGPVPTKLLFGLGGLFVLLIVVAVAVKALSGSKQSFPQLLAVAQEQQQLIQLTGSDVSSAQQAISAGNANFAATTQLVVSSAQQQLLSYLKKNGYVPSTKLLNFKINPSLDQQLSAAATAGNFDATFTNIMTSQLSSYGSVLRTAYPVTGPKGQQLLKTDYSGAQLLLKQLQSAAS